MIKANPAANKAIETVKPKVMGSHSNFASFSFCVSSRKLMMARSKQSVEFASSMHFEESEFMVARSNLRDRWVSRMKKKDEKHGIYRIAGWH